MLTIIILVTLFLVGAIIGHQTYKHINSRSTTSALTTLSRPAKELVKEYNALPKDSRPFPDIVSIVRGLDERTSMEPRRNRHFEDYYSDHFSWNGSSGYSGAGCAHNKCAFKEYYSLHVAIMEVAASVKAKEKAMLEAKTRSSVELVNELTARLNEESRINQSFVEEFKSLDSGGSL